MKKILFAFALILACAMGANAQRTELTIGYGGYTQMDASDCHDGWHGVKNAWGALTAGLNFRVANKLWIGPSYTFSSTTTKGGPHRSHIAYHALLANGKYDYYRNSVVTLYGHLGLGVIVSYMQPHDGDSYTALISACRFRHWEPAWTSTATSLCTANLAMAYRVCSRSA